jgi:bifunctional non-homologous end joining protein LigD
LPDFNALLRRSGAATACFYAFDLLQVGDEDLRGLALFERRALLRKQIKQAKPALLYSDHLVGADSEAMFRHACAMGLSRNGPTAAISPPVLSWVKVKNPAYDRTPAIVST